MSLPIPMSFDTLVGLTLERFRTVCKPPRGEPTPIADGGFPLEWAVVAGLTGDTPAEAIRGQHPEPLPCGDYDPATIAHTALQRLCSRAEVDRIPGVPMRYRPRMV